MHFFHTTIFKLNSISSHGLCIICTICIISLEFFVVVVFAAAITKQTIISNSTRWNRQSAILCYQVSKQLNEKLLLIFFFLLHFVLSNRHFDCNDVCLFICLACCWSHILWFVRFCNCAGSNVNHLATSVSVKVLSNCVHLTTKLLLIKCREWKKKRKEFTRYSTWN